MKKTLFIAMSTIVLWSCTNTAEHSEHNHEGHNHEGHNHEGHSHEEQATTLELNKGEKWVVNAEMKPYVLKGEELVNTYIENNQKTYKILATGLKEQNYQLIKSCTMDGDSHDALHKWLEPHLELVKTLDTETDASKAQEIILQLQNSYTEYHTTFN